MTTSIAQIVYSGEDAEEIERVVDQLKKLVASHRAGGRFAAVNFDVTHQYALPPSQTFTDILNRIRSKPNP